MSRLFWFVVAFVGIAAVAGVAVLQTPTLDPVVPDPELRRSIHVEVLNGCGEDGIASRTGERLRALGFDVMAIGNSPTYNYPESIVIDRAGNLDYARQVSEALGIENTVQQINPDLFRLEEVTVIIGRDHRRLNLN